MEISSASHPFFTGQQRIVDNQGRVDRFYKRQVNRLYPSIPKNEEGKIISAGGRVLGAVGTGSSLMQAREKAYALCKQIDFKSKFYREDIGHKEFSRD